MEYYVEYIFAENFLIDFILLYITGNLIKVKIVYKRLILASLIGALYVISVAYINKGFMTYFIVKISVSFFMIIVAFDIEGVIKNIRAILCFYIVTLIMVGIITALYYLISNKFTVNLIIISMFMGFAILKFFFYEIKMKKDKDDYIRNVTININNKTKAIKAFIDTGNELKDPLTGKPVMVVGIESISEILGEDITNEILEFYKSKGKNYVNLFLDRYDELKLRVLRYNTISNKGEIMMCIVPDNIIILGNDFNHKIMEIDAVIGVYPTKISQKNDYDALLFKKLLDWEGENESESQCEYC